MSFSDSIILFSCDDSEESATDIILESAQILSDAITNEIPMKGAIAFGEMTVDTEKSLYFGKPLIDAYELHKELQIYGVVLHHTTQKRFEDINMKEILDSLFAGKYAVPMKSGRIIHHFLDWMLFSESPVDAVNKLYNNVSGTPRLYVDNTIEYINWFEEQTIKRQKQEKK